MSKQEMTPERARELAECTFALGWEEAPDVRAILLAWADGAEKHEAYQAEVVKILDRLEPKIERTANGSRELIAALERAEKACGSRDQFLRKIADELGVEQARKMDIMEAIGATKARVAELDEERPYWLWRAMLDACADRTCEQTGCKSSAMCITEWCVPCAAREFRYGIMKKEAKGGGE